MLQNYFSTSRRYTGTTPASFSFYQFYRKIVVFSRIQTRIIWVQVEHADHTGSANFVPCKFALGQAILPTVNYTKLGWAWKQEHYGRRLPIFETNQETMSIKKFELHNYATIKERLDVPSHVPSFNQSECFISALSSYAMLKLVYDIVRKFSRLGCYKN